MHLNDESSLKSETKRQLRVFRHLAAGSLALLVAFTSVGCAAVTSEESLAAATVHGAAPANFGAKLNEVQASALADWWGIDLAWDEVDGAIGYQVQKFDTDPILDEEPSWTNVAEESWDIPVGQANEYFVGYDEMVRYRVRAVLAPNAVTEWSDENAVTIPKGNLLYEVDGSATAAFVTYATSDGTQQATTNLPMSSKSGGVGLWLQASDMTPYISAQNRSGYGTVTCRITRKGQVISENTSSGGYAIATCSP